MNIPYTILTPRQVSAVSTLSAAGEACVEEEIVCVAVKIQPCLNRVNACNGDWALERSYSSHAPEEPKRAGWQHHEGKKPKVLNANRQSPKSELQELWKHDTRQTITPRCH